jgi:hypothetical protein
MSVLLLFKVEMCDFLQGHVLLNESVRSITAQAARLSIAVRYMQKLLFG